MAISRWMGKWIMVIHMLEYCGYSKNLCYQRILNIKEPGQSASLDSGLICHRVFLNEKKKCVIPCFGETSLTAIYADVINNLAGLCLWLLGGSL